MKQFRSMAFCKTQFESYSFTLWLIQNIGDVINGRGLSMHFFRSSSSRSQIRKLRIKPSYGVRCLTVGHRTRQTHYQITRNSSRIFSEACPRFSGMPERDASLRMKRIPPQNSIHLEALTMKIFNLIYP